MLVFGVKLCRWIGREQVQLRRQGRIVNVALFVEGSRFFINDAVVTHLQLIGRLSSRDVVHVGAYSDSFRWIRVGIGSRPRGLSDEIDEKSCGRGIPHVVVKRESGFTLPPRTPVAATARWWGVLMCRLHLRLYCAASSEPGDCAPDTTIVRVGSARE
jgi:hypothetical protein